MSVGQIAVGDALIGHDGTIQFVTDIRTTGLMEPVYNMCVEDWHTYYVGDADWDAWSYNTDQACIYNIDTSKRSAEEKAALEEYARRTNKWTAGQSTSPVVGPTKGTLREQASAAATAERSRAAASGKPYSGQAGHVPDTVITRQPVPPAGWQDLLGYSNQVAGGPLSRMQGQTIDVITVDGKIPK